MLVHLCLILCFRAVISQPTGNSTAAELNSLLQDYAFRALERPRTGVVYDARIPPNLTGIAVAALRLRSGTLRRKGQEVYKEFRIPTGVVEQPYVERLVLVYQNLGNWSNLYYPLSGFTLLAPVLGLLAYDGTNLSARNLQELYVRISGDPISVDFSGLRLGNSGGFSPMCVYFTLDGSVAFNNVVGNTTCLMSNQGHISIAVNGSVAPAPAPRTPAPGGGGGGGGKRTMSKRAWIITASVIGGAALLASLALLIVCARKCRRRNKLRRMESASAFGVALPMTTVGGTRAPVASETRTRPALENEFVP